MSDSHLTSETKKPCDVCGSSSCPAAMGWAFRCPEAPIEILESRFADFRKAFDKLCNKARKLGVPSPSFEAGGSFTRIELRTNADGYVVTPRRYRGAGTVIPVTVSGVAPRFDGWSLFAVLEPVDLPDGTSANVVSAVPGAGEVPIEYRTRGPFCDHCRTSRRRKGTYLVRHEDGRVAQVGSDCVADFLGGVSPQQLAGLFTLLRASDEGEGDEEGGWGSREPRTLDLVEYLGLVVREVREQGWISRKAARERGDGAPASADLAWNRAFPLKPGERKQVADEEEIVLARSAVAWALSLDGDGRSDYEHNVHIRAKVGVVDGKSAGIAASIWPSFERAREREVERRKRLASILGSRFQGAVGDKIERFLTVSNIYDLEGDFGVTHLHLFQDAEGNAYKWFASSERLDVGGIYRVSGRVKKHDRRALKGRDGSEGPEIETTVLTRCVATDPYVGVVKLGKSVTKLVDPAAVGLVRVVASERTEYRQVPTTEEYLDWQGKIDYRAALIDVVEWSADLFRGPREALFALWLALDGAGTATARKAAEKVAVVVEATLAAPVGSEAE